MVGVLARVRTVAGMDDSNTPAQTTPDAGTQPVPVLVRLPGFAALVASIPPEDDPAVTPAQPIPGTSLRIDSASAQSSATPGEVAG